MMKYNAITCLLRHLDVPFMREQCEAILAGTEYQNAVSSYLKQQDPAFIFGCPVINPIPAYSVLDILQALTTVILSEKHVSEAKYVAAELVDAISEIIEGEEVDNEIAPTFIEKVVDLASSSFADLPSQFIQSLESSLTLLVDQIEAWLSMTQEAKCGTDTGSVN